MKAELITSIKILASVGPKGLGSSQQWSISQ